MKNFIEKSINIAITKNKPVSLIHFITNRCNARCDHCFIDFENEITQKDNLPLSDIEKLTKSVGTQLMNVNITGGEPFLDPNLEQICKLYLENSSIDSMFFSTNGAMTRKISEIAKRLSTHYPNVVFTYSISIDHIGERHDDYRKVKDLFNKAMKTYQNLTLLGTNVQPNITITVCEENANDIEYIFYNLFFENKVKSITANIVRNEGVFSISSPSYPKILKAYRTLTKLIKENNAQYSSSNFLAKMMNQKEDIMYDYIADIFLNPRYILPCHAGAGLLGVIYPNGDVYPCEILERKMGNLYDYDMNILKLWEDNSNLRGWIKKTKCNCTYECAWSFNLLSSPKHMTSILGAVLKND